MHGIGAEDGKQILEHILLKCERVIYEGVLNSAQYHR